MNKTGIKVFVVTVAVVGLLNVLSSLSSGKSSASGSRRSGYSYSSGSGRSGGSSAPKATSAPKAISAPKATAKPRSKQSSASGDPFDAASYSHPDDFYYDHFNDFWDYEDAEEYWEAHQP